MTSSASAAAWLPAALAPAAVVPPSPVLRPGGRHTAPQAPGPVGFTADEEVRPGRHVEPEWSRELYDPRRDEDPFEWLGFDA